MSTWDTGVFSCCDDCSVTMTSCICLPCQLAYQKAAVNNEPCRCDMCFSFFFCPCCCGVVVRGDIREKYGFPGSFVSDFLILCCCPVCAVAQQTRQLDLKGLKPAGMFMSADPDEMTASEKQRLRYFSDDLASHYN